ncbi:MAG: PAS domain S-box protein, partial [Beijerinckiaceae bacterium]
MNRIATQPPSLAAGTGLPHAQILALAVDAIICIDPQQNIIFFNRGAETVFGYSAEEVLGRSLERLIPPRHRLRHAGHVAGFAAAAPTARHMGERSTISAVRKSGEEFPADATISKIEYGDGFALTVVLRDATERMRAEERRRRDAEKLRQALAAGRLGAFEHDLATGQMKYFGHAPVILGIQTTELTVEE